MKADLGMLEDAAIEVQPKSYIGRFVRKQGQYGTISVLGTLSGGAVDAIGDAKRLFPRDGTVETQGVLQIAGLSPGDWVEFDVVRNARNRSTEYKVSHLRRVPRYAALTEGSEAFYRTLLTREGWRGDRRPGLWALRISGDRVVMVDLELGKDGALRLPRTATRAVVFKRYSYDAVIGLGKGSTSEDVYLDLDAGQAGTFDWSDEADHVARVILSLSDANDPRVSDIITWLDLHHEGGKVFAATVDQEVGLDALRSGELAERLRADQQLMHAYLTAALGDPAVAAAVATHAREGHTDEGARLKAELADDVAKRRAKLLAVQDEELADRKGKAVEALGHEIDAIRQAKMADLARDAELERKAHVARIAELDVEHNRRRKEADGAVHAAQDRLAEIGDEISNAAAERDRMRTQVEAERERLRETADEVDRLLRMADHLTAASSSAPTSATASSEAVIAYSFAERPTVPGEAIAKKIDGLALLSDKGRDLMRGLLVLMLSGEMPVVYGEDAPDFVRLAGAIIAPGRAGVMQADPTLVSVEDLWARPGSGAPTILAAASVASQGGTAALIAIEGVESSGARFWLPALADALRTGALPRALLVCGIAGDVEHDEIKALPTNAAFLEVEGAFAPGASMGALALHGMPDAQRTALQRAEIATDMPTTLKVMASLGFEPGLGFSQRVARMAAEAAELLGDQAAAIDLVARLAKNIRNQNR